MGRERTFVVLLSLSLLPFPCIWLIRGSFLALTSFLLNPIIFLSCQKIGTQNFFLSKRRTISYFQDDWSFITHFSLASSFILSHFLSCFLFIRFSFREQIPWSGGRITWPTETFFGKQFKWKTKRFSKTLLVYRWCIYIYIYTIPYIYVCIYHIYIYTIYTLSEWVCYGITKILDY